MLYTSFSMPSNDHSSPARLAKRSRATDTASGNPHSKRDRTKRRRTSTHTEKAHSEHPRTHVALENSHESDREDTTSVSREFALSTVAEDATASSAFWSMTRGIAGHFTNLDPVITPDEQYIFLALEADIHVYSIATSRLFRRLEAASGDAIIGYRLSQVNHDRLFIFTQSGLVREWDWSSNKQIAQWTTSHQTLFADLVCNMSPDGGFEAQNVMFALQERRDGRRILTVTPLMTGKLQSTIVLEASVKIEGLKIIDSGQVLIAYGGAHIFWGSLCSHRDSNLPTYAWKEIKLSTSINCIDIRERLSYGSEGRNITDVDLALGGADGSVLIYHDISSFFGARIQHEEDKKSGFRRLHWHRNSVTAVRWSTDGNYVLSGGHESVMVLWQLDTGRKQFLPHLSSSICNIVVSNSGNLYAVKLADNRAVVLSARELQPLATISSLQFRARPRKVADQMDAKKVDASGAVVATLHPQYSNQLLIPVPAAHHITQDGSTSTSAPVLQTYDIRTGAHMSRQALARTNATTLNIGPDGTKVLTPDIKHLVISDDGNWMATIDSWLPCPGDVEALNLDSSALFELEETYLKFWRWEESSSVWQLVTRIDSPHLPVDGPAASVLDVATRPSSHEFATIGSDGLLRLWRPVIKQRQWLKKDGEQVPETWKCRYTVNLSSYLEANDTKYTNLKSASVCFSEDGSVLATSLQPTSTNLGLVILIDIRTCTVKYSKVGVYSGDISASAFLGCHLMIATERSVFIWDTVNDFVTTIQSADSTSKGDSGRRLLAVNSSTQTFAVTSTDVPKKGSLKKFRNSGFAVQVYDINSLTLLSRFEVVKEPVALLSSSQTAGFVLVDAGANVQQIGCASKASQAEHTDSSIQRPDFGFENLFGRHFANEVNKHPTTESMGNSTAQPLERKGLASVFGDTPPFVLPPSHIVFRDLVKALSA